jgi:hypothetical protein
MEKRHQDMLNARLEDAFLNGVSHVTKEELMLWYGVQKLAARTIRDIEARWLELTNGEGGRLMKIPGRGGFFIFAESLSAPFSRDES